MSRRADIIAAVIERMETIQISNGFETDLGDRVRDFETDWDDSELPALSVCDLTTEEELPNDQPTATRQFNRLQVLFRIFCNSDTPAEDLRQMIGDVKKAIKTDVFWGGAAIWTKPKSSGIILAEDVFRIGGAGVEIEIGYFTNTFES